ncbi:MAG: ATP-binding cassette domain-containing protein [Holosporales bacterium]|jgi:polar amino acid transport system ATP-binding protein|nr:ATP-binding cassette domain-containing protein [Holosporales bacterium]
MLKVCKINKSFNGIEVLHDVSIDIEKSSIVGVTGPSGSGKSTLLRCIQKLEILDSGKIDCSNKVAFMFQDFQLFSHMTVLQNLTYAPTLKNVSKKDYYIDKANKILSDLGMKEKANEYPNRLSGGQRQRVALARSLMIDPDVLLCDEPTSGLDIATTTDVVTLLQNVNRHGVTLIVTSHNLDFLVQISDKIVLLKDGKIATEIDPKSFNDPVEYLRGYYN